MTASPKDVARQLEGTGVHNWLASIDAVRLGVNECRLAHPNVVDVVLVIDGAGEVVELVGPS